MANLIMSKLVNIFRDRYFLLTIDFIDAPRAPGPGQASGLRFKLQFAVWLCSMCKVWMFRTLGL